MIAAGIEVHAQVVLCPNINDGEILRRTINDLAGFYPHISSVAIVPLGLTRYLKDERLTPVTAEFCRRTIREVSMIQRQLRTRLGTTFAFLGLVVVGIFGLAWIDSSGRGPGEGESQH